MYHEVFLKLYAFIHARNQYQNKRFCLKRFLHFTKDLWNNPSIIDKALTWNRKEMLKMSSAASATAAVVAVVNSLVFFAAKPKIPKYYCKFVIYTKG
jgi:hypothetical protein